MLAAAALAIGASAVAGCSRPPPIEDLNATSIGLVDTYVRSSVPDARWGTEPILITGGWGDIYSVLVRFDAESVPSLGAQDRAILRLFNTATSEGQRPVNLALSVFQSPWDENLNWNEAGALASFVYGQVAVDGFNRFIDIDITDAVRGWQDGQPNFGIFLTPVAPDNQFNQFVSSESPDSAHHPVLRIVRPQ